MSNTETTTTAELSEQEAQQAAIEKENADINACVLEINNVMAEHLSPILQKYGCVQTFRIAGQGSQMQIQQIILKQK